MAALVSVLTPTVHGREALFEECHTSVLMQIHFGVQHLVRLDTEQAGCARMMNALAREAKGQFVLPLADDDLLLPGCVQALLARANGNTIVYSPPLVWGEDPAQFLGHPPAIPAVALIPKAVWNMLGGYDERLTEREDRDLWERAIAKQIPFLRADNGPTWVYRFHGGNKSRHNGRIP